MKITVAGVGYVGLSLAVLLVNVGDVYQEPFWECPEDESRPRICGHYRLPAHLQGEYFHWP